MTSPSSSEELYFWINISSRQASIVSNAIILESRSLSPESDEEEEELEEDIRCMKVVKSVFDKNKTSNAKSELLTYDSSY